MASALVIGPLRRLDNRPAPLNMYRRRDLGIWAALNGLVHFGAGNFVAMNAGYMARFVRAAEQLPAAPFREFLFSGGSILGLIIAVLFLLLLALSSDFALHRVGAQRWKFLQRSALLAFWLSLMHGVAFQILEARYLPMFMLVVLALFLLSFRVRARSRTQG
jgi:DMSO/TMAO reductase YedYZ heme-binding membrane subunit